MAWLILIVAGLFETAWAVGLKYSDGFTRMWASWFTIVCIVISMFLLSLAVRELPIGTAYAVWVGIGAAGSVLLGIWLFNEPLSAPRMFFLLLLLVAIAGLKATAQH